ncbi:hypothetical protein JTE90_018752, partial [Oedothorax gibbosus]
EMGSIVSFAFPPPHEPLRPAPRAMVSLTAAL